MTEHSVSFTAHVVPGVQRGRTLGYPTMNLDLAAVPASLVHGIYACFVELDDEGTRESAVLHYGPRPVFNDTVSCEVYVLDKTVAVPPTTLTVDIRGRIRDVTNFPLREVMLAQIESDIAVARGILGPSSSHV